MQSESRFAQWRSASEVSPEQDHEYGHKNEQRKPASQAVKEHAMQPTVRFRRSRYALFKTCFG
jgi:hypothetical protein